MNAAPEKLAPENVIPEHEAPESDAALWASLKAQDRKKRRQQAWIDRSVTWSGIAGVWQGVRVLGQGGYGLCGLFKYMGNDERIPQHIAVKQTGRPDKALLNESRLLAQLGASGSRHIVKMYKSYHQEGGTGTSRDFDPYPYTKYAMLGDIYTPQKEVSRIYLEYCSRGDAWQWMKHLRENRHQLNERNIWKFFECLARGALVLEEGHEGDNYNPNYPHHPVAHFDLKPQNILISSKDDDHPVMGVFKIADFGLSRLVPPVQTKAWFEYAQWRYTRDFATPEQLYSYHDTRYIGAPCNIWGIAAVMYALVTNGFTVPHEIAFMNFSQFDNRPSIRTMGYDLLDDEICPYSKFFRQTLLTCLAFSPADRPTARHLLGLCRMALDALAWDPSPMSLPPALYNIDFTTRFALQTDIKPRGRFTMPPYIGETHAPAGPDIDELNFGPGLTAEAKFIADPSWPEFPPSPQPPQPAGQMPAGMPGGIPGGRQGAMNAGVGDPPLASTLKNPSHNFNQGAGGGQGRR